MIDLKKAYSGKNVLITGGLGFIGSNLAIRLVKEGANVTLMDSRLTPYGANDFNIASIRNKVKLDEGDIRKEKDVARNIADNLMKVRVTDALVHHSEFKRINKPVEYAKKNTFLKDYLVPLIRPEPVSILTIAVLFGFLPHIAIFYLLLFSLYSLRSFLKIGKELSTIYRKF